MGKLDKMLDPIANMAKTNAVLEAMTVSPSDRLQLFIMLFKIAFQDMLKDIPPKGDLVERGALPEVIAATIAYNITTHASCLLVSIFQDTEVVAEGREAIRGEVLTVLNNWCDWDDGTGDLKAFTKFTLNLFDTTWDKAVSRMKKGDEA